MWLWSVSSEVNVWLIAVLRGCKGRSAVTIFQNIYYWDFLSCRGFAEYACREGQIHWQGYEGQHVMLVPNLSDFLHLNSNDLYYFSNLGSFAPAIHRGVWPLRASSTLNVWFLSASHGCRGDTAFTRKCFFSVSYHTIIFSEAEGSMFLKKIVSYDTGKTFNSKILIA